MDGSAFNKIGEALDGIMPFMAWTLIIVFFIGAAAGSLVTFLLMR